MPSQNPLHMNEFENDLVDEIEHLAPTLQRAYQEVIGELEQLNDQSVSSAQFSDGAVDCIFRAFNLHSANLYLVEDNGEWAVLTAGTSDMARAAIQHGHKLAIEGNSLVGVVVRSGKGRIALDAKEPFPIRYPSAILPPVHSELVVPLIQKNVVTGALDVQSREYAAFDTDKFALFSAFAKRIANILGDAKWRE